MKRNLSILSLFFTLACSSSGYEQSLIYVLEQLRHCQFDEKTALVGGRAIGYAGRPHEFYLLFPYVNSLASHEDLVAMLQDRSPVVRIMAAKCILGKEYQVGDLKKSVDVLGNDKAQVYVMPFGCGAELRTVADVVSELKKNPDYLGDPKEEPNQASEPTSGLTPGRGSP
jgi:hypothetical protein